jgi:drug/metabolite transporter (DMT)-like permease
VVWNAEFVGLLLFLALVGTSFATALWYRLLQSSEVGELTLFLFLVPVVGLAVAAAAFGEPLSRLEVGGALLTVAGIGATTRERSRGQPG